jgi:hypothetical protein
VNEGTPLLGEGVEAGLVGSTLLENGSQIVASNHMPLYYWWKDVKQGDTLGQGVGEVWIVIDPSGSIVRPTPMPLTSIAANRKTKEELFGRELQLLDQISARYTQFIQPERTLSQVRDCCVSLSVKRQRPGGNKSQAEGHPCKEYHEPSAWIDTTLLRHFYILQEGRKSSGEYYDLRNTRLQANHASDPYPKQTILQMPILRHA